MILSKRILLILMLGIVIMTTGCVAATQQPSMKKDTSWMHHDIVDAQFVSQHISVPMPENVMLIDARPYKVKYIKGHIPGAVSIPHSKFDKHVSMLPKDKNALLIYYCGGLHCKLSHKSAAKAEKLGYKNVKVYAKGYPDWLSIKGHYASVTAEHVAQKIADNDAVIIDSRPQKTKFDKGHIPSSISLPFSKFDALKGKLPRNPDTPVIFYCGGLHCRLSHKSADKAIQMGYTNVTVFATGYPAWKKAFGASGGTVQAKAGKVEGAIDLEQFKTIIAQRPKSIMLIDVRDKDEFAKGTFPTAVNIPVEELEPKIKDLPENKTVVYVCSTGARSGEAYYMTKDVRESLKDVYYVEAQITFKGNGKYEIKPAK